MLNLPPSTKIFLCNQAVDMRKSFDALSGLIDTHFGQNPLCGLIRSSRLCEVSVGRRAAEPPLIDQCFA
jgi:hypothetical protein